MLIRECALAFKVGVAGTRSLVGGAANLTLGRIVGAGRTDFSESVRDGSVAVVGVNLVLGLPRMMPTKVALLRDENKKMRVNFLLKWCFG